MNARRSVLRTTAAVGLTALLTACILHLLLTRLGDPSGSWWAGRIALTAVVVTVAALTLLNTAASATDESPLP